MIKNYVLSISVHIQEGIHVVFDCISIEKCKEYDAICEHIDCGISEDRCKYRIKQ